MNNFDEAYNNIIKESGTLIEDILAKFTKELEKDIKLFLNETKNDLIKWTGQLESKQITESEFRLLVESTKAILEMKIERHKGIAKDKIHELSIKVIQIVIKYLLALVIAAI